MIIKTKNIASQFLFQSLFAFIAIGILIFLFVFSEQKKEATKKTIQHIEKITIQTSNLNNKINYAFGEQLSAPDFVSVVSEQLISNESSLIQGMIDSLSALKEINYLKKYFNQNLILDSLINHLKNYNLLFKSYILSLKEKGNTYDGNISDAFRLSKILLTELNMAPDNGEKAAEFTKIITSYFSSPSINHFQTLYSFCEELTPFFYEYDNFDLSIIEENSLALLKKLEDIRIIDRRLYGNLNQTGQLKDLESISNKLIRLTKNINVHIHEQSIKYAGWWNRIIIGIAVLLFLFLLLTIQQFSNLLRKSSNNLINITSLFKVGDIISPIEKDENFEYKTITSNLYDLKQLLIERKNFIVELLEDKIDKNLEIYSKSDEFGLELNKLKEKLQKANQEQGERNKENDIRRYTNEGLAKFADIMRVNSNDTVALGDNLIKELVKYLNAIQGTLFLSNEENADELNMISAFAFDRKKYMQKTVKKGEGLIGTCANELKTIYLTKVPADYTLIKSGLGDTPPDQLIIIPVKHDNNLVGVMELASLNSFNEHEINLTEQIASHLASTIITVRNNTKTAQLLQKSQQQAAEMAEQEEEMRQNMEELKATQEESARREDEMQGIINAIGKTFYIIEYNSEGMIEHLNDKLVSFTEQSYESIIGKKHSDIFSNDTRVNSKLINEIIKNKKSEKFEEELNWGSKKYIYSHLISPIMSQKNEVIKLINLMTIEEKH